MKQETKGFIENTDILEENYKVDDLLDFSAEINSFKKRLLTIVKPSTIGLIGKFGSGKSTMLYQIQREANNDSELWINFDAWKYPDRKDLWEGFVLDFADQVGVQKATIKKIDGKSTSASSLDVISKISEKLALIPGLNIALELIKKLIETSPAKRVFEIQEILSQIISNQKKDIFIIVEDIDRSGDAGIFFLETMKQFISTLKLDHRIVVIVPISDDNYNKKLESYLKTLDFVEFFNPTIIGLEKFVDTVFDPSLFNGEAVLGNKTSWTGAMRRSQTIDFLESLLRLFPVITIRTLKLILRKANQNYCLQSLDGHEPDFRVTICIETAKFTKRNPTDNKSFYDSFKENDMITRDNIFASFVYAMIENLNGINRDDAWNEQHKIESPFNIDFITREGDDPLNSYPSYPWQYGRFNDEGFGICDFYLKY